MGFCMIGVQSSIACSKIMGEFEDPSQSLTLATLIQRCLPYRVVVKTGGWDRAVVVTPPLRHPSGFE